MQDSTIADVPEGIIDKAVVKVDAAGPNLAARVEGARVSALITDIRDEVIAKDVVVATAHAPIIQPPASSPCEFATKITKAFH
jgi:hypothetical protein